MMKMSKKIALSLLLIGLVSQIPFAYHRFQIGRLSERISALRATSHSPSDDRFRDFPGVLHVHTSLGGHSTATIEDLLNGAKGLAFVVVTEHTAAYYDTAAMTLNGMHKGILFVGGNELNTQSSDRLLMVPGTSEAYERRSTVTPLFIPIFHNENRLVFVTYPDRFTSWSSNVDGVEIFNLNESTKVMDRARLLFDALWAYRKYPELTLATLLSRPDSNLQKYDEVASRRRVTLFAGSDAHSNIGFHLLGDDAGNKILRLKFDNYAMVFRIVRTHVLLDKNVELTQDSLLDALKEGHDYVSFDILSDPDGFMFDAGDKIMGDEISLAENPTLKIRSPQRSRIVVLRDGTKVSETRDAAETTFAPKVAGAYRVELFLDSLGNPFDQLPWILSNPIYVRQ
jgi:hypothetical protein